MKTLTAFWLIYLFGIPSAYALTQDDALHLTAHFAGTYAITHGSQVLCTKAFTKEHQLACTLAAFVAANAVNIGYKASQGFPNDTKRAVFTGLAGSATSAVFIQWDFH